MFMTTPMTTNDLPLIATELNESEIKRDFSKILHHYGLNHTEAGYYWQVGNITKSQGWILHISTIHTQLLELLRTVVPYLASQNIPFKIPKTMDIAINLLESRLGYIQLGKIISIYPENDFLAEQLAINLIDKTIGFRGPAIPTDFHLGAAVYTRYGSFNPIMVQDATGKKIKCINDLSGKLIPDPYNIPFSKPKGISWPFKKIVAPQPKKSFLLINKKYYPLAILKKDPKGSVIKAIYFKSPWHIAQCIIKQANAAMMVDCEGRDMTDRLNWQIQLFKNLHQEISMPNIIEYFEENGSSYLAMHLIKGVSLFNWLGSLYKGNSWLDLSPDAKLRIVNVIIEVCNIIERLHRLGYVHRDITPENFLINEKSNIYLIDLELTWSTKLKYPNPPFGLGTPGFISPEQLRSETPTIKEDIYALGGFILSCFTNLLGSKWSSYNIDYLKKHLLDFIDIQKIADIICDCFASSPTERPELSVIISNLEQYRTDLKLNTSRHSINSFNKDLKKSEIDSIIQIGLNGLANPILLSIKRRWLSTASGINKDMLNQQVGMEIRTGWHTGIAGPMWLFSRAKSAGYQSPEVKKVFESNWEYLQEKYFTPTLPILPGLLHGSGGIALAITAALNAHLISPEKTGKEHLRRCFENTPRALALEDGIAGQGIALLQSAPWLEKDEANDLLDAYIKHVLSLQKKDGSWQMGSQFSETGSYYGNTGILFFIISYLKVYSNEQAKLALQKSLEWLTTSFFAKDGLFKSKKTKNIANKTGILLCLILSYSLLREEKFKLYVEKNLRANPARPVSSDFSLESGLTAYGEILIDAWMVFENDEWLSRAKWIMNLFCLTFQQSDHKYGYWIIQQNTNITADLHQGISGILHFLMRCRTPELFSHPLVPFTSRK